MKTLVQSKKREIHPSTCSLHEYMCKQGASPDPGLKSSSPLLLPTREPRPSRHPMDQVTLISASLHLPSPSLSYLVGYSKPFRSLSQEFPQPVADSLKGLCGTHWAVRFGKALFIFIYNLSLEKVNKLNQSLIKLQRRTRRNVTQWQNQCYNKVAKERIWVYIHSLGKEKGVRVGEGELAVKH